MAKKKRFQEVWSNQTALGKRFGISAREVGKILIEHGLKDPQTKEATSKALEEGYAKSTPLKDGTPYYLWNIQKVQTLLATRHEPLSEVDYWVNEVKKILREADRLFSEGQDKLACLTSDYAYDEVPKQIRNAVKNKVEESLNREESE